MIIKYDPENHATLIEFNKKDEMIMWAEGNKIFIESLDHQDRPEIVEEKLLFLFELKEVKNGRHS